MWKQRKNYKCFLMTVKAKNYENPNDCGNKELVNLNDRGSKELYEH